MPGTSLSCGALRSLIVKMEEQSLHFFDSEVSLKEAKILAAFDRSGRAIGSKECNTQEYVWTGDDVPTLVDAICGGRKRN